MAWAVQRFPASGHHSRVCSCCAACRRCTRCLAPLPASVGKLGRLGPLAQGPGGALRARSCPCVDETAAGGLAALPLLLPRSRASSLSCLTHAYPCPCRSRRRWWRVVTGSAPPVTTRAHGPQVAGEGYGYAAGGRRSGRAVSGCGEAHARCAAVSRRNRVRDGPGMCFSSECASDFRLLGLLRLRAARCASTAMTSGLLWFPALPPYKPTSFSRALVVTPAPRYDDNSPIRIFPQKLNTAIYLFSSRCRHANLLPRPGRH